VQKLFLQNQFGLLLNDSWTGGLKISSIKKSLDSEMIKSKNDGKLLTYIKWNRSSQKYMNTYPMKVLFINTIDPHHHRSNGYNPIQKQSHTSSKHPNKRRLYVWPCDDPTRAMKLTWRSLNPLTPTVKTDAEATTTKSSYKVN